MDYQQGFHARKGSEARYIRAIPPTRAIRELLGNKNLYSQEPKNLAKYSADKLKVLKGAARPKDIRPFLPAFESALLNDYHRHIVRSPEEIADIADTADPIYPYWDPTLRTNENERWALFHRLWKVGLLSFRRKIKAPVGIFFVKKKTPDAIRMVIDARVANRFHQPPKHTPLGTAGAYSQLDLSLDAATDAGFGTLRVRSSRA